MSMIKVFYRVGWQKTGKTDPSSGVGHDLFSSKQTMRHLSALFLLMLIFPLNHLPSQEQALSPAAADQQAREIYSQALNAYYAGYLNEALILIVQVETLLKSTNARSSALKARILSGLNRNDEAVFALDEYFRTVNRNDPEHEELQALRGTLAARDTEQMATRSSKTSQAPLRALTGHWLLQFEYMGTNYRHEAWLSLKGNQLAGNGGYPAGQRHIFTWIVVDSKYSGNEALIMADYRLGAPGTTMQIKIHQGGENSYVGTWFDNYQGELRRGSVKLSRFEP